MVQFAEVRLREMEDIAVMTAESVQLMYYVAQTVLNLQRPQLIVKMAGFVLGFLEMDLQFHDINTKEKFLGLPLLVNCHLQKRQKQVLLALKAQFNEYAVKLNALVEKDPRFGLALRNAANRVLKGEDVQNLVEWM